MSRRDFARVGAVAGGVLWTAPRITTIRFAQKIVGSPPPSTTTTTETEVTEGTTAQSTTTTTVCKPGNGFGDKNHCHTGPPGQQGDQGNGQVAGSEQHDPNRGPLAFTGADSAELALVGGSAVVVGRLLYALGRRKKDRVDEPPADADGVVPDD